MLTIYALKPAFQKVLHPFLIRLDRAGFTANQVTMGAVAVSAFTGLAVLVGARAGFPLVALLVAPASLVRMALCALDGMMARNRGGGTRSGAVLNEMGDVVSDVLMYLPLAWLAGDAWWAVVLFVVCGLLAETAGVLAQALGGPRSFQGPMGKSDRAAWSAPGAVLLATGAPMAGAYFLGVAVLAGWTTWGRCRAAMAGP